jgi:aryl-phospho-beta-D-glucosidase BglC (GH1 family)
MGSPPRAPIRITSLSQPSSSVCSNKPDARGWLTTSGAWIVNHATGCRVRLEGVTWFGMQTQFYVPAGLDFTSYQTMLKTIENFGFNSIRIPITDQLVRDNARIRVNKYLADSPDLKGLHPLAILDRIVAQAQADHLWIILDNHASTAVTVGDVHQKDSNAISPLWTAPGYTEADWIHDWVLLAIRYGPGHYCGYITCTDTPTVVGFDLRNEPHTAGSGPYDVKTYLTRGAVWGPCAPTICGGWGKLWNRNTDWAAAATRASNAILTVNPRVLMVVEGVQLYPDIDPGHGDRADHYWWGSILKGVRADPINLATPSFEQQLVYSPHAWGPWKNPTVQLSVGRLSYRSFVDLLAEYWAFILGLKNPHPVWLGEFDTCNFNRICTAGTHVGSQGWWFQALVTYLRNNPEIGWAYYPINGTNSLDEPSNNSILYKTPGKYDTLIMGALNTIQSAPPLPIKPQHIKVTAPSLKVTYGRRIQAMAPIWVGYQNDNKPESLATPATCGTSAGVPGSAPGAGLYLTTCTGAFDPNHTITYVSGTLRIWRAPVVLSYQGSQSVKHGAAAVFVARLRSNLGLPIAGRRIRVTLKAAIHRTQTCVTSATNHKGVGACTIKKVMASPGIHTVVMSFAGDPPGHLQYYKPAMATHSIRVT